MPTGDAAAAAGMDLVAGSTLANEIDTEINKTRDYIAQRGVEGIAEVKATVDAASALSTASANTLVKRNSEGMFGVPTPTVSTHPANKGYVDGAITDALSSGSDSSGVGTGAGKLARFNSEGVLGSQPPTAPSHLANKAYVDGGYTNPTFSGAAQFNGSAGVDGNFRASSAVDFPAVYANSLSGSWRNLYIKSTGELGWVSSSRRLKKNIKNWTPDRQAILAMQIVEFQYKVAIDPDGQIQHGLIAEQLHELGLEWLVDYGTSGTPEGVRYDLISLALLSVVQDHEERLTRLEQA